MTDRAIHKTRAKFYVSGLTLLPGHDAGIKLELRAVCRGDRNSQWAAATPSGSMEMLIQNPSAVAWWDGFMRAARDTGRQPEVFIDIYPSSDGWPGDGHRYRPAEPSHTGYGEDTCGECGLRLDADNYEYDPEQRKSVVVGKVHPNG